MQVLVDLLDHIRGYAQTFLGQACRDRTGPKMRPSQARQLRTSGDGLLRVEQALGLFNDLGMGL